MAKRRVSAEAVPHVEPTLPGIVKSRNHHVIVVPTGDPRHSPAVRYGKVNPESYSNARRSEIPVDPDVTIVVERGGEGGSRKGRTEGSRGNAQEVRKEEGGRDLLREGKRTRKRKKPSVEGEQRLQEGREVEKAQGEKRPRRPKQVKPPKKETP